jgi:hypothetical protein
MNKIRTTEDPKILDQLRVNEVSALYQVNSTVRIDDSFDTKSLRSFNNFEAEYRKEYTTEEEKRIFLASVSKVLIVELFSKAFEAQKDKDEGLKISLIDIRRLLGELLRRRFEDGTTQLHAEINKHTETELSSILSKLIAPYSKITTPEEFISRFEAFCEMQLDENDYVHIDHEILVNLALSASSNIPVEIMANYLKKELSEQEYYSQTRLLAPNFTPNLGNHWLEDSPNIGKLSEFAGILHRLVQSQDQLVENTLVNDYDFGFDFKNSTKGKELVKQGYQIYEKTGYYPIINWVKTLAEEGNPWHLAMCNIVTIVTPSGDVRTFYKNINIEIPWTDDTKSFPNSIRYPAVETYRYKELISKIKGAANTQFRQEQGNFIFSALGINTEN